MAESKFILEENQRAWETYYNNAMRDVPEAEQEKKKISLAQYKCGVIAFEKHIAKPFSKVAAEDMESFAKATDKKNKVAFTNAFLLASVSNGFIVNTDTEFLISLLPKEYRAIGRMIAKGSDGKCF